MLSRRYPKWLNVCSAIALAITALGMVLMIWFTTAGALIAAIGFGGIWITGSLAGRKALTHE